MGDNQNVTTKTAFKIFLHRFNLSSYFSSKIQYKLVFENFNVCFFQFQLINEYNFRKMSLYKKE